MRKLIVSMAIFAFVAIASISAQAGVARFVFGRAVKPAAKDAALGLYYPEVGLGKAIGYTALVVTYPLRHLKRSANKTATVIGKAAKKTGNVVY